MRIGIIGAGSIGLLFAGKLRTAGAADIVLTARTAAQAEKIRRHGLLLLEQGRTIRGDVECTSFEGDDPSALAGADWLCLTVKQTHITDTLINYIKPLIVDGARLLCFQNGIGHVERLNDAGIPLERIYVAVTTEGARKDDGNLVTHTGDGTTMIGSAGAGSGCEAEPLLDLLRAAGFQAEFSGDIDRIVWRKLAVNTVINPLTAVLKIRNGELLSSPYYISLMESLFQEACGVLEGIGFPAADAEPLWEQLLDVCRKTSENSSSMLQDMMAGRETEIEWMNGSIVRLAARQGKNAPTHEAVYRMVKGLSARD